MTFEVASFFRVEELLDVRKHTKMKVKIDVNTIFLNWYVYRSARKNSAGKNKRIVTGGTYMGERLFGVKDADNFAAVVAATVILFPNVSVKATVGIIVRVLLCRSFNSDDFDTVARCRCNVNRLPCITAAAAADTDVTVFDVSKRIAFVGSIFDAVVVRAIIVGAVFGNSDGLIVFVIFVAAAFVGIDETSAALSVSEFAVEKDDAVGAVYVGRNVVVEIDVGYDFIDSSAETFNAGLRVVMYSCGEIFVVRFAADADIKFDVDGCICLLFVGVGVPSKVLVKVLADAVGLLYKFFINVYL